MKKLAIITLTTICLIFNVQSQSTIKLTDKLSYYTNSPETTLDSTYSITKMDKNGVSTTLNQYYLSSPNSSIHTIGSFKEDEISIYEINSVEEYKKSQSTITRDTDTLFFVFDKVYHDVPSRLLINRSTSSYLEEPVWVNETLAYKVLEPCTLTTLSLLKPPFSSQELSIVFKENYEFDGKDTIFISDFDAIHDLFWDPKDINGDPLSSQGYLNNKFDIFFPLENGGYSRVSVTWFTTCVYMISDYHGVLPIIFGNILRNFNTQHSNYLIEYPRQDSIVSDLTLSNNPNELTSLITDYSYNVKQDSNRIGIADFTKSITWTGNIGLGGFIHKDYVTTDSTWNTTLYLDLNYNGDKGYCTKHIIEYDIIGNIIEYLDSPCFDEFNDSIVGTNYFVPEADKHFFSQGDLANFGKGFSYYWSDWDCNPYSISCNTTNIGMYGEYFHEDKSLDVFKVIDNNNNVIQEDSGLYVLSLGLTPGVYTVMQERLATHFDGFIGKSTLTSVINTTLDDNTPPHIINVYLQNNSNNLKYKYRSQESIILKFTASDFTSYNNWHTGSGFQPLAYSNTGVSIKPHYEDEWTVIEYNTIVDNTIIGTQYSSVVSDYITTDSTMYDVKIYVEDISGNSTEHILSPAFIYGDFIVNTPSDNVVSNSEMMIVYPNPTESYFTINTSNNGLNKYKILNIHGLIVKEGIFNKISKINISDLESGIYIIIVSNQSRPKR